MHLECDLLCDAVWSWGFTCNVRELLCGVVVHLCWCWLFVRVLGVCVFCV